MSQAQNPLSLGTEPGLHNSDMQLGQHCNYGQPHDIELFFRRRISPDLQRVIMHVSVQLGRFNARTTVFVAHDWPSLRHTSTAALIGV